ncbi:PadR family transcriptional regulator [Streptomyces olindensis]|uniref:PadR family transcriptional regulator n=1 Tax=Streptomyces olindensis TaxID=358823 RepID=UPI00367CB14B
MTSYADSHDAREPRRRADVTTDAPRLTTPTIGVLGVLLDAQADDPPWGFRICRDTDLGSGTVYPILERLTERGWVRSWYETEPHPGRPARRFYELTGTGRQLATNALEARQQKRTRFGLRPEGGVA